MSDMENFKEIAEKCLRGELSGIFINTRGDKMPSNKLTKRCGGNVFPYQIGIYELTMAGNHHASGLSPYDIIDFIPDDMPKQIKIDVPKGKVPVMEQTEKGVVITWKEKELTYTELLNEFGNNLNCIHVNLINSSSQAFYKKVEVLRKLTNIRNYFGGDKPTNMWTLTRDSALRVFPVLCPYKETCHIYFDTREHAEQAIKILGDELKYLFEPW